MSGTCGEMLLACLFMLCICYPILAEWNTKDYLKREHSLVRPYQGSGLSVPLWDFLGSTMVTNSYIRLTPDRQSRVGALWNSAPCHVRNWELHVQFKIHGSGKDLFGDGFAIWYTKNRMQLGQIFGSMDYFVGLGVFIDSYSNHNGPHNHAHPYISAMVNNGSLHYDHDKDGTHTQLAGCEALCRNKDYETYLAIRYWENTLKVSMDIDGKNAWRECFEVKGVHLPTGYYFGMSAATGQLADNHDVVSAKLYELDLPETKETDDTDYSKIIPNALFFEPERERQADDVRNSGISGLKLLAIIILAIIGICVCCIVGFVVCQKRQEGNRKRFY